MGSRLESRSAEVKKAIEKHKFENEEGEEYEPSRFGGFNDYFRRKKIKLQNLDAELRSSAAGNPSIFRNVVVHVNGYTQPSLNDLHKLVVTHGGGFVQYLDGKTMVTHIVASNLTPKKRVEFAKYRIVKPAWVVDSVSATKLLPWDNYRLLDEGAGQRVLSIQHGGVSSQMRSKTDGYKDQTESSWYTNQIQAIANDIDSIAPDSSKPGDRQSLGSGEATLPQQIRYDICDQPHIKAEEDCSESVRELDQYPTKIDDFHEGCLQGGPRNAKENHAVSPINVPSNGYHTRSESLAHEQIELPSSPKGEPGRKISQAQLYGYRPSSEHNASDQGVKGDQEIGDEDRDGEEDLSYDPAMVFASNNSELDFVPNEPRYKDMSPAQPMDSPERTLNMTSEEHNALLLSDPKVWKSTVVNPGFLKQYYEESRLHHLSTWKAALKSQLQKLAAEKTSSQRSREKRVPGARRYILHVDFDSFFAAVSLRKYPQYIEEAVVVAHGNGSGAEIASCNYPARKYGIKNGMWMKHAQKMCPNLRVLPYDFKAYEDASRKFYDAIIGTGGVVQSVSVDEALVDISDQANGAGGHDGKGIREGNIWREQTKADETAQNLRTEIRESTGCEVSVGIGGNILLAKIALRKAKPAGQHQIKPEAILNTIGDLTLQELPGVAWSIGGKLEEIGVKYVRDVRQLSKERMMTVLGPKTGEKIWDYSRGIDRTDVGEQVIRKSVSAEVNWGIRFVTQVQVDEFVYCLSEELHNRLLNEGVKGRQLTMKIMRRSPDAPLDPPKHLGHGKCDTFNKSSVLGVATNETSTIGREALSLLKGYGFSPGELRGLGIQMQKLEPIKMGAQMPLDNSQKKLQFRTAATKSTIREISPDDIQSPKKDVVQASSLRLKMLESGSNTRGGPSVPLNTLGTQFLLPSQVDQDVLKEIPMDIRNKLCANVQIEQSEAGRVEQFSGALRGEEMEKPSDGTQNIFRTHSPSSQAGTLSSQTQIDQEALQALPQEVRDEVLASYSKSRKVRDQAVLPQSPRKDRTIKLPRKLTTPTKRRGRPLGGGGLRAVASSHSTLTQSNFVANQKAAATKCAVDANSSELQTGEISTEFLSALPEDIRNEVMAQARRDRLQQKSGLDLAAKRKRQVPGKNLPTGQRTLSLAPRPPKPSFTGRKLTSVPELRETMTLWYDEFKTDGPFDEDVVALKEYLRRVVVEEGNMDKAVSVVKWLKWAIAENDERPSNVWAPAAKQMEEAVQEGLQARGLGPVEF